MLLGTDEALLRQYARDRSEPAFAELVRRHMDLVWCAARRITGDGDLSKDVAQMVFSDLARKAGQLEKISQISCWLYRAACHEATKSVRGTARRARRDRQSVEVQSLLMNYPDIKGPADELMALLDNALGQLSPDDRDAVTLRFFAKKSLAEVGAAMGTSDDAAQKRVGRALSRLRAHFQKRGFGLSTTAVAALLTSAATQAAPVGLATIIASSSISAAGVVGLVGGAGQAAALWQVPITIMKTKAFVGVMLATVVATPLVVQHFMIEQLRAETHALQVEAAPLAQLEQEHEALLLSHQAAEELEHLRRQATERSELRAEVDRLRGNGIDQKLIAEQRLKAAEEEAAQAQVAVAWVEAEHLREDTINEMKSLGLASRIHAVDNDGRLPTTFEQIENELAELFPQVADKFEFVRHALPLDQQDSNALVRDRHDLLLFREKQPRRLPDGRFARAYTRIDGSVIEQSSDTVDFEAWERQFMIVETSPPKPH